MIANRTDGAAQSKSLQKICDHQLKRRANAIYEAEQGSVWTANVCPLTLQKTGDRTRGVGIQTQSI